ncbi:uncharacterized protein LOC126886209 [Diabrotica virgifera virgifera]|uniref:HTH psq-type domain-containing protein n=1 Tax=Diabrotica virgifera virgifera TaxID=50390 RepID=A0ABM5KFU6_DIAVI|nr:uncharacterized protein LOC126886209 [Diabrotica virgifera virgifera]
MNLGKGEEPIIAKFLIACKHKYAKSKETCKISKLYTEELLQKALTDVRNGEQKKTVAMKYGIPRQTFQYRLGPKFSTPELGKNTYLTRDEENKLVEWILDSHKKRLNIEITDSGDTSPIEILIGADIAGKLYTGRRHILGCRLVDVETLLGWTLMGKIPLDRQDNRTATTVSLFISNVSISQLWELDALGINDPAERKTREEIALAAKQLFFETVATDSTRRYEIRLPWLGHPALPSNYQMAKKRLDITLKKINKDGYLEAYGQIFKEWLDENIIEEVLEEQPNQEVHYLPHRPVIKPNSASTKIRPVFDASAKEKDKPSLNQCLEKGVNLIELIPAILLRFRRQEIGVISDIGKAFLQIGIHKADRDFHRFLWIDDAGKEKVYRHCRVVFGISSSPFLLGASLEHHFSLMLTRCASKLLNVSEDTILKLSHSFYVGNSVTSVANEQKLRTFIEESNIIMAEGKFDLRGWEYTGQPHDDTIDDSTQVLGIKWNKIDDMSTTRV